jgi:hypothetical protein
MEQSPSGELTVTQLRNASSYLKIHHRLHKTPPLLPVLSQMNPFRTFPPYVPRTVLILSSHLHLVLPWGLFPSVFSTKISYAFLILAVAFSELTL